MLPVNAPLWALSLTLTGYNFWAQSFNRQGRLEVQISFLLWSILSRVTNHRGKLNGDHYTAGCARHWQEACASSPFCSGPFCWLYRICFSTASRWYSVCGLAASVHLRGSSKSTSGISSWKVNTHNFWRRVLLLYQWNGNGAFVPCLPLSYGPSTWGVHVFGTNCSKSNGVLVWVCFVPAIFVTLPFTKLLRKRFSLFLLLGTWLIIFGLGTAFLQSWMALFLVFAALWKHWKQTVAFGSLRLNLSLCTKLSSLTWGFSKVLAGRQRGVWISLWTTRPQHRNKFWLATVCTHHLHICLGHSLWFIVFTSFATAHSFAKKSWNVLKTC